MTCKRPHRAAFELEAPVGVRRPVRTRFWDVPQEQNQVAAAYGRESEFLVHSVHYHTTQQNFSSRPSDGHIPADTKRCDWIIL